MSDPFGPQAPDAWNDDQGSRQLWRKYIYGPRRQMEAMQQGGSQWQFDPSMTGGPAAPNTKLYYGEVVQEPRGLGWQKDVMNYRQDVNDYLADPMTYLSIPGAYDPQALAGTPMEAPQVPSTPVIDAYIASGGVYGTLAQDIKNGTPPEVAINNAVAAGKMTDEQAQQAIYPANDMFTEKIEFDQAMPQYQAELGQYQSSGGRDDSKFQELGLTPPWVQYTPEDLNPNLPVAEAARGDALQQFKQLQRQEKGDFRDRRRQVVQDAREQYVRSGAEPYMDAGASAGWQRDFPNEAQQGGRSAALAINAVYDAINKRREEMEGQPDPSTLGLSGPNFRQDGGVYIPMEKPQWIREAMEAEAGNYGPAQQGGEQRFREWLPQNVDVPTWQPSGELQQARGQYIQARDESRANEVFARGMARAAQDAGASPFNDQLRARQAFMNYLMNGGG